MWLHLVGGADNISSKRPVFSAVHFPGTSPAFFATNSAAPSESPSFTAGSVFACVSSSPPSPVPVSLAIVKTRPAATVPFCDSPQYLRDRLAYRDG